MTNPFADANEQAQRAAQTSQTALGTVQSVAPEGHAVLVRPDSADEGSDPVTAFVVEQYAGDSSLPSQGDRVAIQRLTNDTALMLGVVYGDKGDIPNTTGRELAGISSGAQQVFDGTVSRSSWSYDQNGLPLDLSDCRPSGTVLNGWFYIMGGANGEFVRVDISVNDFSTIQTLTSHPDSYDEVPIVADEVNDVLYLVNGSDGATSFDEPVYEYDPSTDSYTQLATNTGFFVGNSKATYLNGSIYVHDSANDNITEYNPSTDTIVNTFGPFVENHIDVFSDGSDIIFINQDGEVFQLDVSAGTTSKLGDVSIVNSTTCVWYDESSRVFHLLDHQSTTNNTPYATYKTYDVAADTTTVNEITSVPHDDGVGYYRSSDSTYAVFAGVTHPSSIEYYLGASDQSFYSGETGLYTIYQSDGGVELLNNNTGSSGETLFFKDSDSLLTTQVGDLEVFRV